MGAGKSRLRHEVDGLAATANRERQRMKPSDLRAWQVRMGITGLAASELLGVSYAAYKDWRRGIRHHWEADRGWARRGPGLRRAGGGVAPHWGKTPPVAEFLEQV